MTVSAGVYFGGRVFQAPLGLRVFYDDTASAGRSKGVIEVAGMETNGRARPQLARRGEGAPNVDFCIFYPFSGFGVGRTRQTHDLLQLESHAGNLSAQTYK